MLISDTDMCQTPNTLSIRNIDNVELYTVDSLSNYIFENNIYVMKL